MRDVHAVAADRIVFNTGDTRPPGFSRFPPSRRFAARRAVG
jgi:hypothetical protein